MPSISPDFTAQFYSKFSELFTLYDEVKKIVILAEYENKEQKYLITSVNELRNSFDHIMRIIPEVSTLEKNFEKAKGHLYRAGYDAYEIVAISKLNEIKYIKEQFSYSAILEAYPDYHNIVIPKTKIAKDKLVEARAHKQLDADINCGTEKMHFDDFEKIVVDLTKIVDDLNNHIEGIKEADLHYKEVNKPWYKSSQFWIGVVTTGILISLFSLFTEYRFFVSGSNLPESKTDIKVEELTKTH